MAHGHALTFYSIYCLGFGNSLVAATHVLAAIGRSFDIRTGARVLKPTFNSGRRADPAARRHHVHPCLQEAHHEDGEAEWGAQGGEVSMLAHHTKTVKNRQKPFPKTVEKLRVFAQKTVKSLILRIKPFIL